MNRALFTFVGIITVTIPFVSAAGETVSTLDKILNVVIPLVMFGLFGMLIYRAFKEPIDKAIAWARESMSNSGGSNATPEYPRYKQGYMQPGEIKFMR